MEDNLFAQVREACKKVAQQASQVRINEDRLAAYAASLPLERIVQPQHDPASHYLGHGADTVAFFLTLDAINFGSGYFPVLRKRPGLSGYFTIATSLKEHYEAHGPLSARQLAALKPQDCARLFDQESCNVPIAELMAHFATALNDLGRDLLLAFNGSFTALVDEACASAERLARLLIEMPYFRDVAEYRGFQVPFYKRAQIASADLHVAFGGQGPGRFDDIEQLTIFADNLVPHVLRQDGLLIYDEGLAGRIDGEEIIASGAEDETEIRACALHAVELLSAELRRAGHDVPPMKLDWLLWNRGHDPYYKQRPRHRTRTVYY